MLHRIKKDDLVSVISGKDKGKEGSVILIDHKSGQALIKGVAVVTRHVKPRKQGQKGGIVKEESYVPLCKVMPVCPRCKQSCRIQIKQMENKQKIRACHRCQEAF